MDRELITLKALTRVKYGTRRLMAGDVFEVKPRDVRLLIALGKAEASKPVAASEPVAAPVLRPVTAKLGKSGKVAPLGEVAPAVAPVEPAPVVETPADDSEA